jgi:hypothetical protein
MRLDLIGQTPRKGVISRGKRDEPDMIEVVAKNTPERNTLSLIHKKGVKRK